MSQNQMEKSKVYKVREKAALMAATRLLDRVCISEDELKRLAAPLTQEEFLEVAQERYLTGRCGSCMCPNDVKNNNSNANFKLDSHNQQVYRAQEYGMFCSQQCGKFTLNYAKLQGDIQTRLAQIKEMIQNKRIKQQGLSNYQDASQENINQKGPKIEQNSQGTQIQSNENIYENKQNAVQQDRDTQIIDGKQVSNELNQKENNKFININNHDGTDNIYENLNQNKFQNGRDKKQILNNQQSAVDNEQMQDKIQSQGNKQQQNQFGNKTNLNSVNDVNQQKQNVPQIKDEKQKSVKFSDDDIIKSEINEKKNTVQSTDLKNGNNIIGKQKPKPWIMGNIVEKKTSGMFDDPKNKTNMNLDVVAQDHLNIENYPTQIRHYSPQFQQQYQTQKINQQAGAGSKSANKPSKFKSQMQKVNEVEPQNSDQQISSSQNIQSQSLQEQQPPKQTVKKQVVQYALQPLQEERQNKLKDNQNQIKHNDQNNNATPKYYKQQEIQQQVPSQQQELINSSPQQYLGTESIQLQDQKNNENNHKSNFQDNQSLNIQEDDTQQAPWQLKIQEQPSIHQQIIDYKKMQQQKNNKDSYNQKVHTQNQHDQDIRQQVEKVKNLSLNDQQQVQGMEPVPESNQQLNGQVQNHQNTNKKQDVQIEDTIAHQNYSTNQDYSREQGNQDAKKLSKLNDGLHQKQFSIQDQDFDQNSENNQNDDLFSEVDSEFEGSKEYDQDGKYGGSQSDDASNSDLEDDKLGLLNYLSEPPKGFSLEISSFSSLWIALDQWITNQTVAYVNQDSENPRNDVQIQEIQQQEEENDRDIEQLINQNFDNIKRKQVLQHMICAQIPRTKQALQFQAIDVKYIEKCINQIVQTMSVTRNIQSLKAIEWAFILLVLLNGISRNRLPQLQKYLDPQYPQLLEYIENLGKDVDEYKAFQGIFNYSR